MLRISIHTYKYLCEQENANKWYTLYISIDRNKLKRLFIRPKIDNSHLSHR